MFSGKIEDYILFEDKEIIVCRKPAGIAVQNARIGAMDLESSLKNYLGALGWINTKKEAADITEAAHNVHLKMAGIGQNVGNLSGGNQQKVALMKWVLAECSVLILDEPTRGVDVGAKIEIYRIMNELAANGVAIIMISSEMPEIIGMSDRVIVMREGRICGELGSGEISEYNLIRLSMGVN